MGIKKLAGRVALGLGTAGGSEAWRLGAKGLKKAMGGPQGMSAAEIDPEVRSIQQQQMERAKQFRAGLDNMRQEQYGAAEEQSRQGLASQIAQNKAGFSARGLLFSGLRQGADVDAQTESATNLAKTKTDINQGLEAQAQDLENQAMGSASSLAAMNSQNLMMKQQLDLAKQSQRNQVLGSLLGAGGMIGGGYFGGKAK